jgi:hypothetical protein
MSSNGCGGRRPGSGANRKTLAELLEQGSYRTARHLSRLLADDSLVDWIERLVREGRIVLRVVGHADELDDDILERSFADAEAAAVWELRRLQIAFRRSLPEMRGEQARRFAAAARELTGGTERP